LQVDRALIDAFAIDLMVVVGVSPSYGRTSDRTIDKAAHFPCHDQRMLRNICPIVARAAGRLTAPARRPAPSAFAAAANSRPFSSEELVPGVGKGKTSTGLVSA